MISIACRTGKALFAVIAQLVEHSIGNGEVIGSNPINGSVTYFALFSFYAINSTH